MKRSMKRLLLLVTVLLGAAVPSYAWDSFGHMEVAYLAYQKLAPADRVRVWTLLQLNPDFATWEKTIPPGTSDTDKQVMIFMIASIWADEIKNIPPYKDRFTDDNPKEPNTPPDAPTAYQNIGYSDLFRHRYWHFIDVPFARDATPLPPIPQPNAETQIAAFRAVLASTNPDELKSYDLVWLLHLVGDIHQPLHCATRVEHDEPHGDQGGNLVKCPNCEPGFKELHGFWDDLPGTTGNPPNYQDVINAAKQLRKPKGNLAADLDASKWIAEGLHFAKSTVYKNPIDAGLGPFTLTAKYKAAAHRLARQRVALAGARLGNLLNRELK
jgi:hypothetical protein